jgi:hypothetical protein
MTNPAEDFITEVSGEVQLETVSGVRGSISFGAEVVNSPFDVVDRASDNGIGRYLILEQLGDPCGVALRDPFFEEPCVKGVAGRGFHVSEESLKLLLPNERRAAHWAEVHPKHPGINRVTSELSYTKCPSR